MTISKEKRTFISLKYEEVQKSFWEEFGQTVSSRSIYRVLAEEEAGTEASFFRPFFMGCGLKFRKSTASRKRHSKRAVLEDKSLSLRETKQTKKLLAKMSERKIQRYMEYVLTPDKEGLIDTEEFLANDITPKGWSLWSDYHSPTPVAFLGHHEFEEDFSM